MSSKLAEGVNLTVDGVVVFDVDMGEGRMRGCMHPFSFRDNFPELWDELLARPRVQSLYPEEQA